MKSGLPLGVLRRLICREWYFPARLWTTTTSLWNRPSTARESIQRTWLGACSWPGTAPPSGSTSPSSDLTTSTYNFVDGQLIPCTVGDCSRATTAVSQNSWGRIKARIR